MAADSLADRGGRDVPDSIKLGYDGDSRRHGQRGAADAQASDLRGARCEHRHDLHSLAGRGSEFEIVLPVGARGEAEVVR